MDQQKLINHFKKNYKQYNFYQAIRLLTENSPNNFRLSSEPSHLFSASEITNIIQNNDTIELFLSFFRLPKALNNINSQLYLLLYQSWNNKYLSTNKNNYLISLTNNQSSKLIAAIKQYIGNTTIKIKQFVLQPISISTSMLGKNITLGGNSKIGNYIYSKTHNITIYIHLAEPIETNYLQEIIKNNLPPSINFELKITYKNPNVFKLNGSWLL